MVLSKHPYQNIHLKVSTSNIPYNSIFNKQRLYKIVYRGHGIDPHRVQIHYINKIKTYNERRTFNIHENLEIITQNFNTKDENQGHNPLEWDHAIHNPNKLQITIQEIKYWWKLKPQM